MICAPCSLASRANCSCLSSIEALSPVHVVWVMAARTIVTASPSRRWSPSRAEGLNLTGVAVPCQRVTAVSRVPVAYAAAVSAAQIEDGTGPDEVLQSRADRPVVRHGDQVRHPRHPWSESVQALLGYLAEAGFAESPRPGGV